MWVVFPALIDRNSRLACDLHAHRLLLHRNLHLDELESHEAAAAVKVLIGSFVYLTTRHTWNKAAREHGRLLVPETELYELLTLTRRRLVRWVQRQAQGGVDVVLQTALQVASSTTGSNTDEIDNSNRWASVAGVQAEGRYAVASTRTADKSSKDGEADPGEELSKASSALSEVGQVANTALLGVEMDIQIGQMTLRSKHLQALNSNVANHPDVKLIFGESTMQASLLERAEHRKRFRLVGLGHELEVWPEGHRDCMPLGEQYDREYDPSEMEMGERWIAKLFEPVRKAFFNGPQPPPMQFSMAEKISDDAEVAVLIGLHQSLGGPFKLVWVHRRTKHVEVFECVSQGRQWWFTQHLTTDSRYTLREMQPSVDDRKEPYPKWWERGAGSAYPKGVAGMLTNNLLEDSGDHLYRSVIIKRDAADASNLSGGVETFVPKRFLLGVIPQALLDTYLFWQDEAVEPTGVVSGSVRGEAAATSDTEDDGDDADDDGVTLPSLNAGYRRLRGYPREDAKGCEDTMLLVEFQSIGSWDDNQDLFAADSSHKAPTDAIDVTRTPGRTLRVSRLPLDVVKADIEQRLRLAASLEALQLLVPRTTTATRASRSKRTAAKSKSKRKSKGKKGGEADTVPSFQVGTVCDYDTDGQSKTWVQAEVIKVHLGGKLYDLDPKEAWVGRQTRVPAMFLRASQKDADDDSPFGSGESAEVAFEGLTDSEDEEWQDEADDALAREKAIAAKKQGKQEGRVDPSKKNHTLTFDQLDRLQYVLAAVGGDEATCTTICRNLASDPAISPFTDVRKLADAVAGEADRVPELKEQAATARAALARKAKSDAKNIDELLNLVTAPRRSRLHSLLRTIVRIENAGHILAWTKRSSIMEFLDPPPVGLEAAPVTMEWGAVATSAYPWWSALASSPHGREYTALVECPAIDLVELPRIKISFTMRKDYTGQQRLYSMDHSDLFVCNDRKPLVCAMIQGIPHSLLLSNLEGELHVLVPIVSPKRPRVLSEPFSTALVLDRTDSDFNAALASRYFMYPVHVSSSFLLTKGLHAAMYLLLLRLLHRDYAQVFRLTDSVSSDTALPPEGQVIFKSLANARNDCHPDAHACRLKISLVTMDSGTELPWDLTTEAAKHAVKLDCVAATCCLSEEEELQILEAKALIVTDESHPKFDRSLHDVYHMTVVKNRLSCLGALTITSGGDGRPAIANCVHPSRQESSTWPYFVDDTALGETYSTFLEIESAEHFSTLLTGPGFPTRPTQSSADLNSITAFSAYLALRNFEQHHGLAEGSALLDDVHNSTIGVVGWAWGSSPSGGDMLLSGPPELEKYSVLTVVIFQVLWAPACIKAMPYFEQLATDWPAARFLTARADRAGVDAVSRAHSVTTFPTIVLFRGPGKDGEVARIEGPDRCVALLSALLARNITPRDGFVCSALDAQEDFEARFGPDPAALMDLVTQEHDAGGSGSKPGLAALQAALDNSGEVEEGDLIWSWDPEYSAPNIRIGNFGTTVAYVEEDSDDDDGITDEHLLASARWQISQNDSFQNDSPWTDISDPACTIQCEKQYRIGRLFAEGQICAVGRTEGYDISIDQKKFKIVDDEASGMTARKTSGGRNNESVKVRRKGARVKVPGEEKYVDKAQAARDRYQAQYKQTLKKRAAEAKAARQGRDVQGTRGTNSFVEETGVYKWTCKWRHEPSRAGAADAVGISAEVADWFGPLPSPLIGVAGGLSLGLYATGELVHDGRVLAELTTGSLRSLELATKANSGFGAGNKDEDDDDAGSGDPALLPKCYSNHPFAAMERPIARRNWCYESPTQWHCGFCDQSMCSKCYSSKLVELEEQNKAKLAEAKVTSEEEEEAKEAKEAEEASGPEPEPEPEPEKMPQDSAAAAAEPEPEASGAVVTPVTGTKKKNLQDLLPKERTLDADSLCRLFGRNSSVTITLDTDKQGGALSFEVDGTKLVDKKTGADTVTNIFTLLSSTQLYPCVRVPPTTPHKITHTHAHTHTPPPPAPNPAGACLLLDQLTVPGTAQVCMGPLDTEPAFAGAEPPTGKTRAAKETTEKTKKKSTEDDDDEAAAKDRMLEEQLAISEIAHMCRVNYSEIEALDQKKRAELRHRARQLLKTRVPAVSLILSGDQEATEAQAKTAADAEAAEANADEMDAEADEVKKNAAMIVPFVRLVEQLKVEFQPISAAEDEEAEWTVATVSKVTEDEPKTDDAGDSSSSSDEDDDEDQEEESANAAKKEQTCKLDLTLGDGTVVKDVSQNRVRALLPIGPVSVASSVEVFVTSLKSWLPATCTSTSASASAEPEPELEPETEVEPQPKEAVDGSFDVRYTDAEIEAAVPAERVRLYRPVLIGQSRPEPAPLVHAAPAKTNDTEAADNEVDKTIDVPIDRIVWMYETKKGWNPHRAEVSKQMEEALREGRSEIMIMVGETRYTMKLVKTSGSGQDNGRNGSGGPEQEDDDGQKQRLRRHVKGGDGLQADWEMLSLVYSPPMSMVGGSALSVLEKAWAAGDSLNGHTSGFGFLFLYQMLLGKTRVKVVSSGGYADMWERFQPSGKNDAHRFALLLSQLMTDSNNRGLMSSCVNILARNRHVCVRAPKFKDTRKMRQSPVFNGWTDELEPNSAVAGE